MHTTETLISHESQAQQESAAKKSAVVKVEDIPDPYSFCRPVYTPVDTATPLKNSVPRRPTTPESKDRNDDAMEVDDDYDLSDFVEIDNPDARKDVDDFKYIKAHTENGDNNEHGEHNSSTYPASSKNLHGHSNPNTNTHTDPSMPWNPPLFHLINSWLETTNSQTLPADAKLELMGTGIGLCLTAMYEHMVMMRKVLEWSGASNERWGTGKLL
ncbi:hypothetical protein EX30DRAFT_374096 [Ascodesmis nigricans]|uniref:Uncharacterized protein n=1 Tax=Ascodesmis nigricans TaxID=341454 RepID=A0A4S2MM01_9PEZI|nr:hypothetical protein EX30DRAFT_374096 [Ascodesmis nigricans]